MNEHIEKAKKFFKEASEKAEQFEKVIPDKFLGDKLRKSREQSAEIVKHIEERQGTKQG